MPRLHNFLTEKVNKREIEEALKSTDVRIGAEFEFKIHEDRFMYELSTMEDAISDSENYDEQLDTYKEERDEWESARLDAEVESNNLESEEDSEAFMNDWDDNNPEPERPEEPFYYIERWQRNTEIPYDTVEQEVKRDMKKNGLGKYLNMGWVLEEDSSLDQGYGIELKSPPMEVDDFLVACEKVLNFIEKVGYTDNQCGLHIGVSLKSGMSEVDAVKLAMFTDEEYIWKNFEGRKTNIYTQSMREKIRKDLLKVHPVKQSSQSDRIEKIEEVKSMIKTKNIKVGYGTDHYHGINTQHMDEDDPYIEFRYMGGSGYSEKWSVIRTVIAQYIYNLKLSRDPEFKKEEYIAKCNRILLKLETWAVLRELEIAREQEKKGVEGMNDALEQMGFEAGKEEEMEMKLKMYTRQLKRRLDYLPKLSTTELSYLKSIGA